MKKISAVFVFSLTIGGVLWAQSEEPLVAETEASSALSADAASVAGSFRQEGVASWYGAEFAGRPTASGEIFDPSQFTAAHADLAFGTYLVVTNTENGKRVAVRVNDRGPFVRSRIIDVSRAAAERLDMLTAGTAKVVVESVSRESAQSLMRDLGTNPVAAPSSSLSSPQTASSRTTAPTPSASAATASSSSQTTAPRTTAPAPSGTAVAAESSLPPATAPRTTASGPSSPQMATPRTTAPASSETAATTEPSSPSPQTTAPRTTGTPVMAPTAPRIPVQPAATPVPMPSASVSRVTGQVENIPEIRRPSDSGYIVVDEQLPQNVVPRTSGPVITPAPSSAVAPSSAAPPSSVATPDVPQTTDPVVPQTTPPPATSLAATPRTAAPEENPAASVPVTGPRPRAEGTGKTEYTGSPIVQGKNYRIQVGSFTDLKNASEIFLRLSDAGLSPSYEPYEEFYRVVITNVKAEDAEDLSRKLAEIGVTEALAREDTER